MQIKLLVEGGNMTPGPAVAQQLGPIGVNLGEVISQVNEQTKQFKGITVPVHLDVDTRTKEFSIKVLSPPTSELIKKELGIEKASGERLKTVVGNLAIEQVIAIAKTKHQNMLSQDFLASVKSVTGTCMALGTLIESEDPKEILEKIKTGKFKAEIEAQKTEVDSAKKKKLDAHFKKVIKEQEAAKAAEEAEKAAEEAAKAKAAAEGEEAPAEGKEAEEGAEAATESEEKPAEQPPEENK